MAKADEQKIVQVGTDENVKGGCFQLVFEVIVFLLLSNRIASLSGCGFEFGDQRL
jgi:hypothetical protein